MTQRMDIEQIQPNTREGAPAPDLYDLSLAEIEQLMAAWGQPAFRARQIYRQLYINLAGEAAAMTDLPKTLRERIERELHIGTLRADQVQVGDGGMTRKALFHLPGGEVIESVLMVYADRAKVCVSTQAGCAMGCVFCATGRLGLLRNLSAGQIVEQVLWAARELRVMNSEFSVLSSADSTQDSKFKNHNLSNIVFMGMGEPFANYDRWRTAVERIHDPAGFNMGARSLTVSTVGLPQGIRRLAADSLPINLAISLHAPNDSVRSALMPINDRFPLADLMAATRAYVAETNRRVSFEYVLLEGRNDEPEHAAELAELLHGQAIAGQDGGLPLHLIHVNLIPWNPVPGMPLGRSAHERVLAFQRTLHERGIACTVRVERGLAIAAACGQLAGQAPQLRLEPEQDQRMPG
jgi:23S rRNA (adenine2503-C2)-methyltransferase